MLTSVAGTSISAKLGSILPTTEESFQLKFASALGQARVKLPCIPMRQPCLCVSGSYMSKSEKEKHAFVRMYGVHVYMC